MANNRSGEGYKAEKDRVLLGKIIKSAKEGERFRWELRVYEGSKPRIVVWREFWGREQAWVREIKSENKIELQFIRSIVRNVSTLAAHCLEWEQKANIPRPPSAPAPDKFLETLSATEREMIESMRAAKKGKKPAAPAPSTPAPVPPADEEGP